ncbi:Hydrogenobyrinate a,c-diamide synthase [Candidatus Hodgkinia cicadicola]|uniref:Hydrogenobyrinate a,c-diamide synthase n=1 Tax=Candidatus Hodgkinia cicadicola TaxID=573658 RepID=A0ABX4MH57_9HYPH|nr:Hydrogenobyrinate a,c-diamide synthase [Candidatus Hodgkinia cicadicola]
MTTNNPKNVKLSLDFGVKIVRDAILWFIYENSLLILYFLGYIPRFEAPFDNEIHLGPRDQLFIPGGYPELQSKICNSLPRTGIRFRWSLTNASLECGGYILIAQWTSINSDRKRLLGLMPIVNIHNKKLIFIVDKVSSLINLGRACSIHEFHYVNEISQEDKTTQFISRSRYQATFKGYSKNNTEGSYLHNTDIGH